MSNLISSLPTYCRLVNLLVNDPAKEIATASVLADLVDAARLDLGAMVNSSTSELVKKMKEEEEKHFKVAGKLLERVGQLGQAAAAKAFKFSPTR